jgi:hypothetical protein
MGQVPEPDAGGFVQFEALANFARTASLKEFAAAFPQPALRITVTPKTTPAGSPTPVEKSIKKTLTSEDETHDTRRDSDTGALTYERTVAFLKKRPRNPFPQMISIGRALNNDIVFLLETVSKVHAYFLNEGGRWSLSDNRSRNGTTLNLKSLEPGKRFPVKDGDKVQLGLEVNATFVLPETLYDSIRGA